MRAPLGSFVGRCIRPRRPGAITIVAARARVISLTLVGAILATMVVSPRGQGPAPYTFTVMASLSGPQPFFPPSINNQGHVAFVAGNSAYRGDGETVTAIAGAPGANGHVSINDAGTVAFRGLSPSGFTRIMVAKSAEPATILAEATPPGALSISRQSTLPGKWRSTLC